MRLAVFTPLNPARSGISDYSEALLPHLARHLEIEVFIDDGYEPQGFPRETGIAVRNWREHRPEEFDEALYQFGNNPFHVYIYDAALRSPGVLLMHEFNMHHLVAEATIRRGDWDGYMREVEYEGDAEDLEHARRARALEAGPDYDGLPLSRRILESAKAVIVHSRFMARKTAEAGVQAPVWEIPHGAWIPKVNRNLFRAKLGVDEATPLIGIFGFLKPYKRIKESLRAMRRLVSVEPRARMILVGEEHPDLPVRRMIADLGLSGHVRVLGYTPIEDFVQYIGACDICLNLRHPTAGETSGTLLRALGLGRAVIVSDNGAFSGLPDEICLKTPVGPGEPDLIFEYLRFLISNPGAAAAIGERARNHVASECSWPRVAALFAERLEELHTGHVKACGAGAPERRTDRKANPEPTEALAEEPPAAAGLEPAAASHDFAGYILGFCDGRPESAAYAETHLTRLVRTLELAPPGSPDKAALEMGAYMHITPALKTRIGYGEVRGCYLGPPGKISVNRITSASGERFECEVDHFNAERDTYPYADGRFALVVCCELLEHLYDDPMHMMGEINRILEPGGALLLSTPNACSLRAVSSILLGYHPGLFHQYLRPGQDGQLDPRHAREYAPRDVQALFEAAGFEVEHLETSAYLETGSLEHEWVKHLLERYELPLHLRGECVFALGRKAGPVRQRYPAALYEGGE